MLYWNEEKYISDKLAASQWGDSGIDELAEFIKNNYPTIKEFNRRGLYRMKQFYETYKDNEFVSSVLTQISWTNHLMILSKTKTIEEKEFYIKLCVKERYSSRKLERQIDSAYFERYMLSSKAPSLAIKEFKEKTENTFLDTYVLEFLSLPETVSEVDLRKAIFTEESFMADIKYEIKETIGTLSESSKGWKKELNLISWNDKEAKYDLRDWDSEHKKMGKGITLSADELKKLREILNSM